MKKGFILTAVILVAVGAVLFGAAFAASGSDFSALDTASYQTNTYTVSDAFDAIEIRTEEADVALKPSEDGELRVVCAEREKVRHEVCVEEGTLKITAADERAWYDYLTPFSFRAQSVTVYLPAEHYAALKLAAGTGDVSVPEQFSFAEAELTASTGDVAFGASVDGGLRIKTSTGKIGVSGVHTKTLALSTSTGRIEGRDLACEEALSVQVSTGKTLLTDVVCNTLDSDGSTGDVTLKNVIAKDSLRVQRSTGDVRFESCDAGELRVKTSTGSVTGTLRTEKLFVTKTSTGKIKVPDTTSGGRCEITTSTGRIEIALEARTQEE